MKSEEFKFIPKDVAIPSFKKALQAIADGNATKEDLSDFSSLLPVTIYEQENINQIFQESTAALTKIAVIENPSPSVSCFLYLMYYFGLGVEKNSKTSNNYLNKSATAGYAPAQHEVWGHILEIKELSEGLKYFGYSCLIAAANQKYVPAEISLLSELTEYPKTDSDSIYGIYNTMTQIIQTLKKVDNKDAKSYGFYGDCQNVFVKYMNKQLGQSKDNLCNAFVGVPQEDVKYALNIMMDCGKKMRTHTEASILGLKIIDHYGSNNAKPLCKKLTKEIAASKEEAYTKLLLLKEIFGAYVMPKELIPQIIHPMIKAPIGKATKYIAQERAANNEDNGKRQKTV